MAEENKSAKQKIGPAKRKWLNLAAVFLLAILLISGIFSGAVAASKLAYADKFYPNVKIDGLSVSGQTKAEVFKLFDDREKQLLANGLLFAAEGKSISINPITVSAADPDLAKTVLDFDWQKTLDLAYAVGRRGNFWGDLGEQLKALFFGADIPIVYYLDETELQNELLSNFSGLEKPPLDAKLIFTDGRPEISDEQSGYIFDYALAIAEFKEKIARLDFSRTELNLIFTEALITKEQAAASLKDLDKILAVQQLRLTASSTEWLLKQSDLTPWLEFQQKDGEVTIGLNRESVLAWLETIAQEVALPALDAKFTLAGNKVTEFQASQTGKKLDVETSYNLLTEALLAGSGGPISLPIIIREPDVDIGDVNNLGIKELIGRGTSNFAGSPKNRRTNIAVGAKSLNGIIIEPAEEFSMLKALGPIDGEHGYLQELVIKGNRTIPEYGGGLCQIGTTAFRVALNSGLPITQRRNHSYRVVYYEPAGMDATIYDPAPDFRFLNDTGNKILFITKISADNLIFEFYGTDDGRQVVISPNPPAITKITSPGAVKYIETEELAPGEKRLVEKPHNGADTYFKYTVTYPGGEVKETEFTSHYVAWPETWLIGKTASDRGGGRRRRRQQSNLKIFRQ